MRLVLAYQDNSKEPAKKKLWQEFHALDLLDKDQQALRIKIRKIVLSCYSCSEKKTTVDFMRIQFSMAVREATKNLKNKGKIGKSIRQLFEGEYKQIRSEIKREKTLIYNPKTV